MIKESGIFLLERGKKGLLWDPWGPLSGKSMSVHVPMQVIVYICILTYSFNRHFLRLFYMSSPGVKWT